jgi:DNA primase
MTWVSFDDIKRTVSLQMVLDRYGFPLKRTGPGSLRGKCPLPTHSSKESKASFIVTLNKGTGGAWSCHSNSCVAARGGRRGGNALDLVAAMERCSLREAALKLQQWFSVPPAEPKPARARQEPGAAKAAVQEPKTQLVSEEKRAGESDGPNAALSFSLKGVDPLHPYLRERGILEETARTFGIGFFPGRGSMSGRIVIPIHNREGQLVAYAGRAIGDTEPRYKFPAGFRKSLEVFNLHRVMGEVSVVVVEGFFDCMKVSQAGFPCVGLMGCTMSRAQEDAIAGQFGKVVLMLDGDTAGREAAEGIYDRLAGSVYQVEVVALPDNVQPDQLAGEEISRLLTGAVWMD